MIPHSLQAMLLLSFLAHMVRNVLSMKVYQLYGGSVIVMGPFQLGTFYDATISSFILGKASCKTVVGVTITVGIVIPGPI